MSERLKAVTIMLRATHHLEDLLKQDIESYGLNTAEFGTLEYLYHKGPRPIQKICQNLLMANSSMTYVIDKLEKKNYVTRMSDKNDRRVYTIALTKEGEAFIKEIFPQHEKRINEVFAILSDDEIIQLNQLNKKIGKYSEKIKSGGN